MAWTAPRTWVTGETVTAALMNTHVRDNLLETAPAIAQAAGDIIYADGANSLTRLAGPAAGPAVLMDTIDGTLQPVWRQANMDRDFQDASTTGSLSSFGGWVTQWGTAGQDLPKVTVTTTTCALVVVMAARVQVNTVGDGMYIGHEVSGATTLSATIARGGSGFYARTANENTGLCGVFFHTGLTAGSNTFQMQGRGYTTTGTKTIENPSIFVQAY